MRLDKFQQFVKDGEYEPDLNDVQTKIFMQDLCASFDDKYQELKSDIENSLDMSDIVKNSLACNCFKTSVEIDQQIKLRVNELIVTTLEEIEDIEEEAENNEPCDIESFKRDREINQ